MSRFNFVRTVEMRKTIVHYPAEPHNPISMILEYELLFYIKHKYIDFVWH